MSEDKLSKLIEVAKLYYQFELSQQQIAEKLGISRPSVSRMLQQAKEQGIVQIKILDQTEGSERLAELVKKKFSLKDCLVIPVPDYHADVVKTELGKAAAVYVGDIVQNGDVIGTTWGTTLYEVAQHVKPKNVKGVSVVQLNGGVSYSETNTYASDILHFISSAFHTVPHFLPLPAIFDHPKVAEAIRSDRHIKRVLDLGKQCNIALFTVGEFNEQSTLYKAGYFTTEDLSSLQEHHAVGDICSRVFNQNGIICNEEINKRTIGIDLVDLRDKRHSILIAGGASKVEGIYGALIGRFPNVLITDQHTAQALLEMEEGEQQIG
ncbi:DNA-binding transcriptional repressor DeoR [Bacillus carboniphilus]|uniref:DNA-binding transcriptional repressor DeoR n=1 Tax=Bacillus carboniphilus TaxID=86663 RepID=A0ABN0WHU6_9BACI